MLGSQRVSAPWCGLGRELGSWGNLASLLIGLQRLNQVAHQVAGLEQRPASDRNMITWDATIKRQFGHVEVC